MTQKYWHVPISTRPICPVCKKAVYSRSGIHPQCAMREAESARPVKTCRAGFRVHGTIEVSD